MARWFRDRGITAIGVCFLHSYANPAHERRMREVLRPRAPRRRSSRISSDVLREYREYERSVTTLVDAAVKPTMRRYIANLSERLGTRPFSVMKSNGGVLSAAEVVQPADHHRAVRPGRGRARRRAHRRHRRATPR